MEEIIKLNLRSKTWSKECPADIRQLLDKIKKIQLEKDEVIKNDRYDFAAALRDIEIKQWTKLQELIGNSSLDKYLQD